MCDYKFQSPRNRVNTSNAVRTRGQPAGTERRFQSPRNRVNTSNASQLESKQSFRREVSIP